MRYWLLRRPLYYGDINPSFVNKPWDYDKVFVNPRLHPGDIVYLVAPYNELYGWGHVIKKESYQDNELNGRAYKITVTRPVVQILTGREEVRSNSELAPLFQTDVNLIELNLSQVNVLNALITSKGGLVPPPKLSNEPNPAVKLCSEFPKLEVPEDVKIWMLAAYQRVRIGKVVDPQQMVIELWPQIPDFNYKAVDERLMRFGFELTLLGILQIDPKTELCDQTDQVIRFIRDKIQKQPNIERVTAEEVSEALEIPESRIALVFALMNQLGNFWNGAGSSGDIAGYRQVTIKDEHVKRQYLKYEQLESLLKHFANIDEKIGEAPAKPEFVHSLLDWKFDERLDAALNWINRLAAEDVSAYDAERLAETVERFAIAPPIIRTDKVTRDVKTVELEDLMLERKTGGTGHIFLIPVEGEVDWLEEVNMQVVPSDNHPLGFLNKSWHRISLRLTLLPDDPQGALNPKLEERLGLVKEYGVYIDSRIVEFNKALTEKMAAELNKRKTALERAQREAAAIGLPTEHNPEHAETAIKIEALMQKLNVRFKEALPHAEQLFQEVKALAEGEIELNVERAKLLLEKADDALQEFGNTEQEKKVQLRKWKETAQSVLPPGTIKELRERAEGQLLKGSYPRSRVLRTALLIVIGLAVVVIGAISLIQSLRRNESNSTSASRLPSITPSPNTSPVASNNGEDRGAEAKKVADGSQSGDPICIRQEESKTVLDGSLTISLGGISYEGSPLRHFVDVVLSSPRYRAATFRRQENGSTLRYQANGLFEVNVASTDTFSACFYARKIK